jgi:sigma-B regulation protein RsbU (phosphoserine phosphatase)
MVIEKSGGVFKVWLNGKQHLDYVDTNYPQYSLHHFTGLIVTGRHHYLYEAKLFKRKADPDYIRNATAPFDLRLKNMPDQVFEAEFFPKRLTDEKVTDVYLKRVTDLRKTQKANARLLKQKEDALNQVNSELQIAASVLNRLLPKEFPEVPGVTFVSYYKPSGHVGSDLFDVFRVDNDRIAVLMYDVSGHGVPAALISVMTRTLFQKHFHTQQSLIEQLDCMNRDLTRDIAGTNFVTLFFGLLDFKAKELKYVGAGFIPPVMVQQDKLTLLNTRGIPLGMRDRITSEEHTMELKPGAKLILYTDGLYEIFNRKNEMYTWKRFIAFISKLKHLPIKTLIQKMVEEHAGFTDVKTPRDDVSLLGIEID